MPGTPRTDPYLRNYLIRLLLQVMTPIRTKGLRMAHDLTYPLKRTGRAWPALCPGHVLLNRIPLGQPPSLPGLRCPSSDVVRPLPRYYCAVRLPIPVRHWIVSLDFPMRPWYSSDKGGHRISRFPCKVFPYAPRSPSARLRGRCDFFGLSLRFQEFAMNGRVEDRLNRF